MVNGLVQWHKRKVAVGGVKLLLKSGHLIKITPMRGHHIINKTTTKIKTSNTRPNLCKYYSYHSLI